MIEGIKHAEECTEPTVVSIPAWVLQKDKTYQQLLGCTSCGASNHTGFLSDKKEEEIDAS